MDSSITSDKDSAYLKIINQFTINLLKQDSMDNIVWSVAKDAIAHLGFVDCVIYLVEEDVLVQKAAHGPKNPIEFDILNPITIPIGQGIVGTVAKTGNAIMIDDTSIDERYILDDDFRFSELAVPIVLEGKVIGVIDSEHPEKAFYTETHLNILTTIASLTAIKISQAKAQQEIQNTNFYLEELVKERTKDLELALTEVKKVNRDLQHFAYSISHDLRQPLRMISSYVQLLKRRFSKVLDKDGIEYIDFAYNGATEAQRLVMDLLQYSKVGVNTDDFEEIDLNKLLESVLINLRIEIKKKKPIFEIHSLPIIYGVKSLINQLFQNLIHNAIKFSTKTSSTIVIGIESDELVYKLYVRDSGVGISEAELETIFQPFSKATSVNNIEGTGLGLAICEKIVRRHKGKIWVESEVNKGSTFYFTLPKEI